MIRIEMTRAPLASMTRVRTTGTMTAQEQQVLLQVMDRRLLVAQPNALAQSLVEAMKGDLEVRGCEVLVVPGPQ